MHIQDYKLMMQNFPRSSRFGPTAVILIWDSVLLFAWYRLILVGTLWGWVIAQFLLAIVMFNAFALFHEAVHQNISSRYKILNKVFGYCSSVFCLLPYSSWREDHLQHHLWSGNLEKDPVMKLLLAGKNGKLDKPWINLLWRSWLPVFAPVQILIYWFSLLRRAFRTAKLKHWLSLAIPATVWAAIFLWTPIEPQALLGSLFIYFFLSENINIPNHTGMDYIEGEARLAPKDQESTSQSCSFPGVFRLGVLMNFNLHAEHHIFPHLPWFQLPAATQALEQRLGSEFRVCNGTAWLLKSRSRAIKEVVNAAPSYS